MVENKIKNELKKINFNALERVTPSVVSGRTRRWKKKLKINSAIWQVSWHYGVGKNKDKRYGNAYRYANFPKSKSLSPTKWYKINHASIQIEISKAGSGRITKFSTKEDEYTSVGISHIKKF